MIFIVVCDGCNTEGPPGATRHTLEWLDWRVVGGKTASDKDLCPRCR